jgi:transmembrane sensor
MTRWFGGGDRGIDELIDRSLRNELTRHEADRLAAWRSESAAHETQYLRTVRLLASLRGGAGAGATRASRPPSVQALLARRREPAARRFWQTRPSPSALWLTAAAAAVALVSTAYATRNRADGWVARTGLGSALTRDALYATGASEMATVQLSDGSVVRLAPSSTLQFQQHRTTREATLDGRAFFDVTKSAGRAFHVHTRFGDATVFGTRFELATEAESLELLVVSGRVGLAGSGGAVEVHAGEASAVRDGAVAEPTPVPNAATMDEWAGKFLVFQATPIREVAREIEATYGVRLVTRDSVIADRTVTGTFTDRDVHDVIDAVCAVVNARCSSRPGTVVMTNAE